MIDKLRIADANQKSSREKQRYSALIQGLTSKKGVFFDTCIDERGSKKYKDRKEKSRWPELVSTVDAS